MMGKRMNSCTVIKHPICDIISDTRKDNNIIMIKKVLIEYKLI